jgi:tripartite-type tricarboxylate transporter receptor subunit TctC
MFNRLLPLCATLLGAAQLTSPAIAQDFPTKQPIKIVVPVPPGGGTDALARITAEFLQRRLGQTVIVENKPGASSTIGADYVYKSPADGYTLLLTGAEFAVVPAVRAVPYKFDQFTYVYRAVTIPSMIVVGPKSPYKTFAELLAAMKAKPGDIRYGSTGIGAIVHVGVSMFEGAAGVKTLHVPYSGIGPVFTDLLGGTSLDFTMGSGPYPEGIRPLVSGGSRRSTAYPDLPTLDELGIRDAAWDVWFGILAPPNLPTPVADRLAAEIGAIMKDPAAIVKIQAAMQALPDKEPLVGETFKKQTLEDHRKWKAVVDRNKIVVQ